MRPTRRLGAAAGVALALLAAPLPAAAQVRSSANFSLSADGVNAGGGVSSSANYVQRASAGQPFATPPMAGTTYSNQPGLQAAIPGQGVTLLPASLAFGARAPGATSPAQTVTLANSSGVTITITSIDIPPPFGLSTSCSGIIAPGASCTFDLFFEPVAPGDFTGAFTIGSNAAGSPHSVALSGTGSLSSFTLGVTRSGSGTVSSNPPGLVCSEPGGPCSGGFAAGTLVTLSAAPAPGQVFSGWGGACASGIGACQLTMNADLAASATFGAASGQSCAPAPFLLVSWWPGEDSPQDLLGANHASAVGGVAYAPGMVGRAFDFDGTNRTVQAPDSTTLDLTTQFTFAAWVRPRSFAGGDKAILSKIGGGNGTSYQTGLSNSATDTTLLFCQFSADGESWPGNSIAGGSVAANTWSHVACTYDHDRLRIYVNGAQVGSLAVGPKTVSNSIATLRISGDDNNHVFFDGLIDEPQIYARGLSGAEVATLHAAGAAGMCTANLGVSLATGFNLTGNGFGTPLDVAATFGNAGAPVPGVTQYVDAVWSWNAATQEWRFFSPQLTVAESAAYAAANGFEPLLAVPPGEGYWVNAYQPFSLPPRAGAPFSYGVTRFAPRPSLWNLLAIGAAAMTPGQFNAWVGPQPVNFESLWVWDSARQNWYFYSPDLEQPGAPFTNAGYAAQNGLLDFSGGTPPAPARMLGLGGGFWVYRP